MIYVKWKLLDTSGPSGYGVVRGSEEEKCMRRRVRITLTCPTCDATDAREVTTHPSGDNDPRKFEEDFRLAHTHEGPAT